jgi:phenylacetic acid degradation operon negative regulatory protein
MPTKPLSDAIDALTGLSNQRVWSLLVTVFGDLAQNEGEVIDGPVLSAMMSDMGIKPEATRVALHRLRNDDWIVSVKNGRTSQHSLTASGRQESAAASPRIYNPPSRTPKQWQLVILDSASAHSRKAMAQLGFSPLMPRVYLGSTEATAPNDGLVLTPTALPRWLAEQFEPKDLAQDYAELYQCLLIVQKAVEEAHLLTPRDRAVLRCLIVHNWRRLVLKHPELPRDLYSPSWLGHECRVLVSDLLHELPKPELGQILLD